MPRRNNYPTLTNPGPPPIHPKNEGENRGSAMLNPSILDKGGATMLNPSIPQMARQMLLAIALIGLATTSLAGRPAPVKVTIEKFQFTPQEISIRVGDTVSWTNREKRQYHSIWFEQLGEPEPDYLFPGEIYRRTFNKAGTFPYRCGPHLEMTGTVRVE